MRVARWILASGLIVAAAPLFAQIVVVGEGSETIGNTVEKKQVGRAGGIQSLPPAFSCSWGDTDPDHMQCPITGIM